MKKYDCIFLDRDGTLNPDPGYINSLSDFNFFKFTNLALSLIAKRNIASCIITNQSGLSRGLIDPIELNKIHDYIRIKFENLGVKLLDIYVCPDHPEHSTEKRKPGPGMFLEAEMDHNINLMNSLMIGDAKSDIQSGEMLGMDTMLVLTGKGEETMNILPEYEMPTYIAKDLKQGAEKLCH